MPPVAILRVDAAIDPWNCVTCRFVRSITTVVEAITVQDGFDTPPVAAFKVSCILAFNCWEKKS